MMWRPQAFFEMTKVPVRSFNISNKEVRRLNMLVPVKG